MNPSQKEKVVIEGEIALWIDQGAIHLKLMSKTADPIELTSDNARRLAEVLLSFVATIDKEDAG